MKVLHGQMFVLDFGTGKELLLVVCVRVRIEADDAVDAMVGEKLDGALCELLFVGDVVWSRGAVESVTGRDVFSDLVESEPFRVACHGGKRMTSAISNGSMGTRCAVQLWFNCSVRRWVLFSFLNKFLQSNCQVASIK